MRPGSRITKPRTQDLVRMMRPLPSAYKLDPATATLADCERVLQAVTRQKYSLTANEEGLYTMQPLEIDQARHDTIVRQHILGAERADQALPLAEIAQAIADYAIRQHKNYEKASGYLVR